MELTGQTSIWREDELQRLRALHSYEILDTEPEPDFDALTRLARRSLNVPIVGIALAAADRIWCKSQIGLRSPELSRETAICCHALVEPKRLFVVKDLQKDERFKAHPFVTAPPHARFYAAAPLIAPDDHVLGTVTVVDTRPHLLTRDGQAALKDLAVATMGLLERRRQALHFKRLARTDYLTGLANRAQFQRALRTIAAHANRTGNPFSILCLDLNDFKAINDQFGHAAGDTVLSEVARRLQAQVRADDIVARLGGDEFAIIMQDCDRTKATALRDRIGTAMSDSILLAGGTSVHVGVSIDTASTTGPKVSETELLAQADAELYREKPLGSASR